VDEVFDADYRRWGGPCWLQNTRLPYWSMLYSGDYDLMRPLFRMLRDQLPLRTAATKTYFGHDGAYYPETAHFWGNYADGNYGFNRGDLPHGTTQNQYIRRHWVGIIEIVGMMLDYYEATGDTAFRDDTLIPMAVETFRFYDQHWKRGENGQIRYSPSQSLETYWDTVNPTPDIASMRYLLPRLLALPVADAIRAEWTKQLADQPEIPLRTEEGKIRILPAQEFGKTGNVENPELYAIFPFRLFTVAGDSEKALQVGIDTYHARRNKANIGWQQGPIWAACLGLADEAKAQIIQRAKHTARGYRFPGFYGPNYDWTPDQDQISVFQIALQRMLMQTEGEKILLLPAWPADWNVRFKLHAPDQTTVEVEVRDGRVVELIVTPESRRKDVTLHPPFELPTE
jgi:alpha-L-fucosidase 2